MLKEDAIPTIFAHNVTKQPQKRMSSIVREEAATKKQLCDDAFLHDEMVQSFEFEYNTKSSQTESNSKSNFTQTAFPSVSSTSTQVSPNDLIETFDATTQCNIELLNNINDEDSDSEIESFDESESTTYETESDDSIGNEVRKSLTKEAFIVYWSSLVILFKSCLTCSLAASVKSVTVKGSQLIVQLVCINKHQNTWKSQPIVQRYSKGNLTLAAAVLFSANTFQRISKYFDVANIQWIAKTAYYSIQKKFLAGIVNKNYLQMNAKLIERLIDEGACLLSGDGRCDSPGYNAKYLTYSLMDQKTNEIIAFSLTQVSEAGNSNRMEKLGFQKTLHEIKENNLVIRQLTTDRHIQIRKYLREEEPQINHQFDVWHFAKNIKVKLLAAGKKSSCIALQKWTKSIINHFWWACGTSEGNEELLREKWLSVLFHVQNKHSWTTGSLYRKCSHSKLTKKQVKAKEWLSPSSEAFAALQAIVTSKSILNDLKHLTQFSHTGTLEIFHALYNKWAPKSQHFSYQGMIMRSQLAIMDFNSGSALDQATTKSGEKRYNTSFSKLTNTWSSKPIKTKKHNIHLSTMVQETLDCAASKTSPATPQIPLLPPNIAKVSKPEKEELTRNQISRFK